MKKYTITKDNYTSEDVNNALSLHSMSVKFENKEDQRIYTILHNNSYVYTKKRIIEICDRYKNKLNLLEKINSKRKLEKIEINHKITFLIRCIKWGKKLKEKNSKYIHQFYKEFIRILAQIFQSYKLNKMLWISRDNKTYVKKDICRYFEYIFKNDLLCLIFDILEDLGYIDGIGFESGTKHRKGRSSRYMPSGICNIFDKMNGKCEFIIDKIQEVVILKKDIVKWKKIKFKKGGYIYVKDTIKKLKKYKDNDFTNNKRGFVEKLNAFYSLKKIEVNSSNILLKKSVIPKIYHLIINKRIRFDKLSIEKIDYETKMINEGYNEKVFDINNNSKSLRLKRSFKDKIDDENKKCKLAINNLINEGYNAKEFDINKNTKALSKKHTLCQKMATEKNLDYQKVYDGHVFIKELKFEILDKSVRSIFNRGSFDYGGRFYGNVITELPKILRKCLFIDGEPVLSGDFKAFHIYLAYHLAGIQCPMTDPYDLPGTNREEMKLASLVAINAPDLDSAVFGTMNKINSSFSKYKADESQITEEDAECLVTTFMYNHNVRIASDYGVTLQNLDSIIMQDALDALMDEGICGLGVHDEVVVPEKHIDRAVEIMIQAYKKQPFTNGFEPIVDVDKKRSRMPRSGRSSGSNDSVIREMKPADDGLNKAA